MTDGATCPDPIRPSQPQVSDKEINTAAPTQGAAANRVRSVKDSSLATEHDKVMNRSG